MPQAAQAGAVLGGRHLGLVEHLDGDGVTRVNERGKADQRLPALANLHQLGQFAKGPGGVALFGLRGGCVLCSLFRSCLRFIYGIFRWFFI